MHIILVNDKIARQLAQEILRSPHTSGLRICVEDDQVKFKVNHGCWSPSYGELDPQCDEAYERRRQNDVTENRYRGDTTDSMKVGM